ncbi:hypothetical protein BGX38DRAFT_1141150 [Terfezia claveryi]|nr:hypothetical protein BGX38DRAFT_1141150 [Terfezia claveryi]
MPAPMFPPTPAPSTDIAPKPAPNLSNIELSFQLPPPAIGGSSSSSVSSASSTSVSPWRDGLNWATPVSSAKKRQTKSRCPSSPTSPNTAGTSLSAYPPIAPMPAQFAPAFPNEKSIPPPSSPSVLPNRKRSSATQAAAAISQQKRKEREEDLLEEQQLSQAKHQKTSSSLSPRGGNSSGNSDASGGSSVTLPPPPGRSRKIIQMKPKPDAIAAESNVTSTTATTITAKGKASGVGRKKATAPQQAVQPAKPTAATRKTARKTAHSLIERRRRFKMNEEFAVLKSMIPACQGVEMHKLAILQASIEYLRYLEDCVEKLKKMGEGGDSVVGKAPGRRQSGIEEEMEEHDQGQDGELAEGEERDEIEYEEEEELEEDDALERDGEQSRSRGESLVETPLTFIHHQHQLDHRQEPQQHPNHNHNPPQPTEPPERKRSMSVAASPKTFLPKQIVQAQAADEDREVTHALLLLKGDGGDQGESSRRESGSVSGRSSSVSGRSSSGVEYHYHVMR